MLLLKLLEESDSEVVYSYFPEKKKYFGIVKINKITGEIIDVQTADNDLHKRRDGFLVLSVKGNRDNKL